MKDSQKILNISLKKGNLSTFLVESCFKVNNLSNDAHFLDDINIISMKNSSFKKFISNYK